MEKYECIDRVRTKIFNYDKEVRILNEYFEKYGVKKVLELGCGTGPYCCQLAN